ncbi:hypothetical protein R3P38DRAFT_3216217 [Favolaschia claudopus]|uniref:Uncharacterized protein n=1 Tax=Favolaschia claudopus TaxID=2862362 RepID=A0AAW0A7E1_9AGAR
MTTETDDSSSGVEAVFADLDKHLVDEDADEEEGMGGVEEADDEEFPATLGDAEAYTGKKSPPSLMKGEIYSFALIKKALDNVAPAEEPATLNVVRDGGGEDFNIEDLL